MALDNIKIFDKLLNVKDYSDIREIVDLADITTDDITLDISDKIQDEFIKSYAYDFIEFFNEVRERNEYEVIEQVDDYETQLYKNDLYALRMFNIRDIISSFLRDINHIKRHKGMKDYVEFILSLYLTLKFYQQYELEVEDTTTEAGTLDVDERYLIVTTSADYFGEGKVAGNIFLASNEKALSTTNSVKKITSIDTTYITSGNLENNKKYLIVKCEDDHFFAGCKKGSTFLYDYSVMGASIATPHLSADNIVIGLPTVIVDRLKPNFYTVQSIISENEYDRFIKPLVHPVGWLSYYYEVNSIWSESEFLQPKNLVIADKESYANLNYYFSNIKTTDDSKLRFINTFGSSSMKDLDTLNKSLNTLSGISYFDLMNSNISDGESYSGTHYRDFQYILKFSTPLSEEYLPGGSLDLSQHIKISSTGGTDYDTNFIVDRNVVKLKITPPIIHSTRYITLKVLTTLEDIYNNNIAHEIQMDITLTLGTSPL